MIEFQLSELLGGNASDTDEMQIFWSYSSFDALEIDVSVTKFESAAR